METDMPMPAGGHTIEGNLARERVLAFITRFEKEHGYMPLIDEIASAVRVSDATRAADPAIRAHDGLNLLSDEVVSVVSRDRGEAT
jgi:hypothetical protein